MSANPLLSIEGLTASVDEKTILHNVNLNVAAGETHVLMGPNGAGKSTLGHLVMGDPVYTANGPKDARAQLGLKRQFLHSFRVRFTHPETSEELEFADNLPHDLDEALRSLGDRSRGVTDAGRTGSCRPFGRCASPFSRRRATRIGVMRYGVAWQRESGRAPREHRDAVGA